MNITDLLSNPNTTNSDELNEIGTLLLGKSFVGVFPADMIPDLKHNGECLIFNNKNSNHNGEHWLGLINECNKTYAFDTYGRNIKQLNDNFKNKKWIMVKHRRTEAIYGQDCGQQTLAFLCTVRAYGINNFIESFKN